MIIYVFSQFLTPLFLRYRQGHDLLCLKNEPYFIFCQPLQKFKIFHLHFLLRFATIGDTFFFQSYVIDNLILSTYFDMKSNSQFYF